MVVQGREEKKRGKRKKRGGDFNVIRTKRAAEW